jgi:mRNA-degrading endonuclease toxin of MazEF toxin-antitoxin module
LTIEQGDVFDHNFGPRQNNLQEGSRPVLVVQTDTLNKLEGYGNVIVVPLTTKERLSVTYIKIEPTDGNGLDRVSWAITNQVFTIGKDELEEKRGSITKEGIYAVKQGLKISLSIQ